MAHRKPRAFPRPRIGAMGDAQWTVGGATYYWRGPGSRLFLVFHDQLVTIDDPRADGSYDNRAQAEAALRRFLKE